MRNETIPNQTTWVVGSRYEVYVRAVSWRSISRRLAIWLLIIGCDNITVSRPHGLVVRSYIRVAEVRSSNLRGGRGTLVGGGTTGAGDRDWTAFGGRAAQPTFCGWISSPKSHTTRRKIGYYSGSGEERRTPLTKSFRPLND